MATTKKQLIELQSFDFLTVLHSLLHHGRDEKEIERAKGLWEWFRRRPELKHACIGPQFDIFIAIWKLASENGTLPSYDAMLQEIQRMGKNEEPLDILKNDYLPMVPQLKAFGPEDMPAITKQWTDKYDQIRLHHLLQKTNQITLGSVEFSFGKDRDRVWSGPEDAVEFFHKSLYKDGLFYQDQVAADDAQFAPKNENVELFTGHSGSSDFSIMGVCATDITPKPIKWLWPNRFPLGKMALSTGKPDCGKSMVTIDIVARVTTGADWPDGAKNTLGPKTVLMAVAEDDLSDTVIPRLMAAGADLSRVKFLSRVRVRDYAAEDSTPEDRNLELAADVEKLKMMVEADPEIALVIVDTITSYFGDVNTNADKDVRPVMDALSKAFSDCGAAFIGIIHHNKRSDVDAVQKILGASSVAGSVRAAWGFSKDPDNKGEFFMSHVKGNVSKEKGGMKYRIIDKRINDQLTAPCIEWLGQTEDDANELAAKEQDAASNRRENLQSTMAEALIIAAVANGPRESDSIYAEAMAEGVSGYAVKKTLANLKKAGRLFHYQRDRVHYWSKDVPELKLEAEALM